MAERFVQPDNRIPVELIGTRKLLNKVYAVHVRPGCPQNATIEVCEEGIDPAHLRCWACKTPLSPMAANHVIAHFQKTDKGTFIVP